MANPFQEGQETQAQTLRHAAESNEYSLLHSFTGRWGTCRDCKTQDAAHDPDCLVVLAKMAADDLEKLVSVEEIEAAFYTGNIMDANLSPFQRIFDLQLRMHQMTEDRMAQILRMIDVHFFRSISRTEVARRVMKVVNNGNS